ncbi:OFA family oxalate/formate antiporter-like MFS transporter [Flavobacterium araucananum]|uniref:MFS transporter n=1 Tax=Flavobacterium araucananum TaxID=946678 RepID=A0A227PKL1_9FLAO|nr:OFA family MFS transporter [Flavobacterium araucananum]OXG09585.1 MFS transporter [Flavobacterium araucananum]PWK02986.1 OFA family oxalate/formate antiporter-like MFS transporter [Flavobacterium araucananum]
MIKKNKWVVAAAGMLLQLSIGSIYAYSVWINPIYALNGWDGNQLKLSFSLAICFLGLTAAFMQKFVRKTGPKKAGLLAALFFGIGLIGSGFAIAAKSLPLFYLCYGVISGIGLGFGYITPIWVVVKWFPEKPGFAGGLVIMSFALGSVIASRLILPLVDLFGVSGTFYWLGSAYFILMTLASLCLWLPVADPQIENSVTNSSIPLRELLKDVRFYSLWLMLFLNTTCGIALISIAAPMAKEIIHITDRQAINFVAFIGFFNGFGRLFWSSISDKIGRWSTFFLFFAIGACCFLVLSQTNNPLLFQILIFIIISCYGGAFATMPAFVKDIYGSGKMSAPFGFILIAWSVAAFVGPGLLSLTSDYTVIFYLFAALLSGTAIMCLLVKSKLTYGK